MTDDALTTDAWISGTARLEMERMRVLIAAEIEQFADDDSDISDAYRHAAMIAKGIPGA